MFMCADGLCLKPAEASQAMEELHVLQHPILSLAYIGHPGVFPTPSEATGAI